MGHLSFTEILDTSLKVSWQEPLERNGIITGKQPFPWKGKIGSASFVSTMLPRVDPGLLGVADKSSWLSGGHNLDGGRC